MATQTFPTYEEFFKPFVAYGKMAAESAEKVVKIQMDSAKAYTKLGMDNFSEGFKVTDFDKFTTYAEKQKDIAKTASDMFMTDAKEYADIGAKFFDDSKGMFEESVKSTMAATKKAATAATK